MNLVRLLLTAAALTAAGLVATAGPAAAMPLGGDIIDVDHIKLVDASHLGENVLRDACLFNNDSDPLVSLLTNRGPASRCIKDTLIDDSGDTALLDILSPTQR